MALSPALRRWLPALGLALALSAVHLLWAGWLELAEDEAYYWVWSRQLAAGYFDHPPAVAWMIAAGTALLGDTERGVRLGAAALGLAVCLLAAAVTATRDAGEDPGPDDRLMSVLLVGTLPLFALGGLLATPDVPLLAAWAGALLAAARGRWAWVGLCCGLAMLSKYSGVLLLPGLIAAKPAALRGRGPWLAGVVAFLVYLPNALWNLDHGLVSWRFQLNHAAAGADRLGFLAAQIGLAGPLLFFALLAWLAVGWRGDRVERLAWWTAVPVLAVALWSGGEANWAAPAWLSATVGLARRGGRWRRYSSVAAGASATLCAAVLIHAVHPLISLPRDPLDRLAGGRTLGEAVAAWGQPVVFTTRYQEAALIHFYGGVPAVALPDEGRPDQYDLWPTPQADHALFVRPWRASTKTEVDDRGWERGAPNTVSAYVNTANPLLPRLVGRWQIYEMHRSETPAPTPPVPAL